LAFFLQLFAFLLFTQFIATLIRKPIMTMGLMFLWVVLIENGLFIWGQVKGEQWVEYLLPVKSINSLIHVPFPKYALMEIQDYIAWPELALVIFYGGLFYWATTRLVVKRDL